MEHDEERDPEPAEDGEQPELPAESTMQALIEYIARGVVEQPEAVSVTPVAGRSSVVFELRVAADDMGKVIGKDGRVAKAMRSLLKVVAAKERKRAILEIV